MKIEAIAASTANYSMGRQGYKPIAIVHHEMQGTMEGTISAFRNPEHQASAHYGVGAYGRIVQFVAVVNEAYSNGNIRLPNLAAVPWIGKAGINPNLLTISIEWEGAHKGSWTQTGFKGEKLETLTNITTWWTPTEPQYQAALELCRYLIPAYGIAVDRAHICRHSDFDSVAKGWCPGNLFPMARLLRDLGDKERL